MNVVSLFSGCGGLDLGFIQAGFNIIWANDIDKYAVQSYRHNIGDHIIEEDLTKIPVSQVPEHDVLIGGFPCQPFSMMGEQKGFTDTRGTLFFNIEQIILHHNPKVVVLENVRNLVNHDNGRTYKVIKEHLDLAGYEVFDKVLNSVDYGVPQTRNRIFIVCFKKDLNITKFDFPKAVPLEKTLQSILETNVPAKYYLSQKILPTIMASGTKTYKAKSEIDLQIARPLCATMAKMHRASQDNYVTQPSDIAEKEGKTNIRRLTPRECARLQGFPEEPNYEIIVSDSQAYKQFGNAVTVNVAKYVAKAIFDIVHSKEVETCELQYQGS
ncbi:DNA cytosine methyltransferase [Metabacillus halosaccharovorans]|uniref:DNA cytosine methyltransferase n=1 Tax=Metabacillus halosaccharovorans TaxID=930124 RepID=UPI000995CEFD|nr:DNA cytosine methyltransferase [Metabacillus halosaccharovorans]